MIDEEFHQREGNIKKESNKNSENFKKMISDIDNSIDLFIGRIETAERINKLENDFIKLVITQTKHKVE